MSSLSHVLGGHVEKALARYNICFDLFQVKGPTDTSNFDDYPGDESEPPDDLTGWDKEF